MKKLLLIFIALVLTASLVSCGKNREAGPKSGADPQVKVLATVNDVPITEYDMKQLLKKIAPGMEAHQEVNQNLLQALVRNELIYQKALELGLDKDQAYRQKLNEIEAQLREFKRQEMSALFYKHVNGQAEVKDAEAQDYFAKNEKLMQTKFHVWQIFYHGKYAEIEKDNQELKGGMSFEKVAARRFKNLPPTIKAPWDLGDLYWNQMPQPWQGIVDRLEPGQVTDIIKGPGERFWLIKLVKKTVDSKITFATEKARIVELLRQQKVKELYERTLSQMKEKAKISFPK